MTSADKTALTIGVAAETLTGEKRVALTPDVTKKLVAKGFAVVVEQGAGAAAHFCDDHYADAGARMATRGEALAADVLLAVRRPAVEDVAAMSPGVVLLSHLESCAGDDDELVKAVLAKGGRVIALERIPRISRAQSMDVLSSQSNIAGYRAVIEAAAHYGRFMPVMMTSAGSAKPARAVVLGAGVAGLQAIATARRLGAEVFAYDVRPETKEQILSLGAKAIELDIGESGSGEGGYAKELSAEAKERQQALLADELAKAHIIITTALIPCRPAPILVPASVVERMREGSVIVDLAAANGGNCELTEKDQVVTRHGVIIVGHTNYPSMVASDASAFLAQNLFNLLGVMVNQADGGPVLKDLQQDEITRSAMVGAAPGAQ